MLKGSRRKYSVKHNILSNHSRMTKEIENRGQRIVWSLSKNQREISWTGRFLDHTSVTQSRMVQFKVCLKFVMRQFC